MVVGTRDGRITSVRPAMDAPVNRGHLCVKGRSGFGFVAATDRPREPLIRREGVWRPVSWDEAVAVVADGLQRIIARDGPGAIGVLGSARATNEDNYLVQKMARAVLGTNNTDCCARVCHAPSATALHEMLGTGAATNSFTDVELARTILVCGANVTENHPVVGARIKHAALAGTGLIVIDPRRIELADFADVHLQPRPGTNVLVLNAMAASIIEEGLVDDDFVRARVDGLEAFSDLAGRYRPEDVAARCGVAAGLIRDAARRYASAKPAMSFHGLGLTEHHQGTEGVMSLVNLALLTGNVGRRGAGVNPLRGQNNVQGAAHMGCEPHHLPGYAPVAQARERVGAVWGAEVPEAPGIDAVEMLAAAADGGLRALWVVGWDLLLTQPEAAATRRALANLELLVVQDVFLNETERDLASVFLPAANAFEKDGTFMNGERRVQRVRKVVEPPSGTKPDWEIMCLVARAMGRGHLFEYQDVAAIWEEIRRVWPAGAGMTYARLDAPGGLQWPCPDVDHPGTALLHAESFAREGRRAGLRPFEHLAGDEEITAERPLVLVTGRSLYEFNAGTMTRRSATHALRPTDLLEVSPTDSAQLGLADGDLARVESEYGEAVLSVEVTDRAQPGVVFATFHDPSTFVNRVTSPSVDPYTHTPEYKVTAVRVDRVR
jgi:formate dehydrogenase major subunit